MNKDRVIDNLRHVVSAITGHPIIGPATMKQMTLSELLDIASEHDLSLTIRLTPKD